MKRVGRFLAKVPSRTLDILISREFWSIVIPFLMLMGIVYAVSVLLDMGDALRSG